MRKFATAAFSFAAGVFLAQYLISSALWRLIAAGMALLLAGGLFLFPKSLLRRRGIVILCALSAALLYCVAFEQILIRPARSLDGTVAQVEWEVLEYPEATVYGAQVKVALQEPELLGVKAIYYGGEEILSLRPGNRVTTQVAFSFTEDATYHAKGIFLQLRDRGEVVIREGNAHSIRYLPQHFAKEFLSKVNELYNKDTAPFMSAILMGNTDDLAVSDRAALREAGLWHITAVSGLHCSILISLLAFFLGKANHKGKALLGIPLVTFYALSVGGEPSVVRAAIMIGFVLLAPLVRRENDSLTALSAALAVILAANPFAAASLSLQLSFGAVLGLLLITPRIREALLQKADHRVFRPLAGSISATLGALVFTAPLCALYFNVFTIVTLISALFCLWAVTVAFSLGMLSVLVSFLFVPAGEILAFVAEGLSWYVLHVAEKLSAIPYHAVYFTDERMKCWFVYAYALLLLCLFLKEKRGRRIATATLLICCALVVTLSLTRREETAPPLSVTVLDVGRGQCVILTSGKEAVVVDCGSSDPSTDAGKIAAEELFRRGFYDVKAFILTHPDGDHSNGAASLCARASVAEFWMYVAKDEYPATEKIVQSAEGPSLCVTAGKRLIFGEARLSVYAPDTGGSNNGLAVLCTAGDFDVLITGDMDQRAEEALLEILPETDIEVLLAGHHGSDDACGETLLQETKPEAVIVSVGENTFGQPGREALMRIKKARCALYRTDRDGSVTIKAD